MRGKAKTIHIPPGDVDNCSCPVCPKICKSPQGLLCHLRTARSCSWYRLGKNPEPRCDIPDVVEDSREDEDASGDMDVDVEDFRDILESGDLFRSTLPSVTNMAQDPDEGGGPSSSGQEGPRSSQALRIPALDDDEDTRGEEEDELAGRVIRMDPTIVETWKSYFGVDGEEEDNQMDVDEENGQPMVDPGGKWKPFASELDWQVAMWVIREDVGQKSLNRFLCIPGVSPSSFMHALLTS